MKTFKIKTQGCKVNQCESENLKKIILKIGLELTYKKNNADMIIINTCAVTQKASTQSRQLIRKLIRLNPKSKIIVMGCCAQIRSEKISEIKGIDFIITDRNKHKILVNYILKNITVSNIPDRNIIKQSISQNMLYKNSTNEKTRKFLKIQDGCDSFCTYCIVPYTRGRNKSLTEKKILKQIQYIKHKGFKEIVLTGIHIGRYGKDLNPKTNLYELLLKIIKIKIIERIRISSIEPQELSKNIINLARKNNIKSETSFCKHFHISLQSGDDSILKKMHRSYNSEYVTKLVKNILYFIPGAAIGLDILVGFPGETKKNFKNTYNLINNLEIAYLHIFPFSQRNGTLACNYTNQVPNKEIKLRCKELKKLDIKKRKNFYNQFLETTVNILVEGKRDKETNKLKGFSENYIPVRFNGPDDWYNNIKQVRITKISSTGLPEGICISKP